MSRESLRDKIDHSQVREQLTKYKEVVVQVPNERIKGLGIRIRIGTYPHFTYDPKQDCFTFGAAPSFGGRSSTTALVPLTDLPRPSTVNREDMLAFCESPQYVKAATDKIIDLVDALNEGRYSLEIGEREALWDDTEKRRFLGITSLSIFNTNGQEEKLL